MHFQPLLVALLASFMVAAAQAQPVEEATKHKHSEAANAEPLKHLHSPAANAEPLKHKHSEAANAKPLKHLHSPEASADPLVFEDDIPKEVRHFQLKDDDWRQACEYWNLTAEKYYTIEGGAATVKSDCKPTDQANKVIAAYVTQYRKKSGAIFSFTGPHGDALKLNFLKRAKGGCKEIAPDFCAGDAKVHQQKKLN